MSRFALPPLTSYAAPSNAVGVGVPVVAPAALTEAEIIRNHKRKILEAINSCNIEVLRALLSETLTMQNGNIIVAGGTEFLENDPAIGYYPIHSLVKIDDESFFADSLFIFRLYDAQLDTDHGEGTPLIIACRRGKSKMVEELISVEDDENILPNEAFRKNDSDGMRALNIACEYGDVTIINELLKRLKIINNSAQIAEIVNYQDSHGQNPLLALCKQIVHESEFEEYVNIIELLLDNLADHTIPDDSGHKLEDYAFEKPELAQLLEIFERRGLLSEEGETKLADQREADARKAEEERLARVRAEEEERVSRIRAIEEVKIARLMTNFNDLVTAIKESNISEVERLLAEDPSLATMGNKSSGNIVHIAASAGNDEIFSMVLEHSAHLINNLDATGCTPLMLACQNNHENIARIILLDPRTKDKVDINIKSNTKGEVEAKALGIACQNSLLTVVNILYENFTPESEVLFYGDKPVNPLTLIAEKLTTALAENSTQVPEIKEMARFLISKGVEITHDAQRHLVFAAVRSDDVDFLDLLLSNGVNPNQTLRDDEPCPAFYLAVIQNKENIVRRFMEHPGCDVNLGFKGKTPFGAALRGNNENLAQLLIANPAVNVFTALPRGEDADGFPLLLACAKGYTEIVAEMIARGGEQFTDDLHRRTTAKASPLSAAAQCCDDSRLLAKLLENGADPNNIGGHNPLTAACVIGNYASVVTLFDRGATIEDSSLRMRKTPLFYTCEKMATFEEVNPQLSTYLNICEYLLSKGNPVSGISALKDKAAIVLDEAVTSRKIRTSLAIMSEFGILPSADNRKNIKGISEEVIRDLYAEMITPDFASSQMSFKLDTGQKFSLLELAAFFGNFPVCEALVLNGHSLNLSFNIIDLIANGGEGNEDSRREYCSRIASLIILSEGDRVIRGEDGIIRDDNFQTCDDDILLASLALKNLLVDNKLKYQTLFDPTIRKEIKEKYEIMTSDLDGSLQEGIRLSLMSEFGSSSPAFQEFFTEFSTQIVKICNANLLSSSAAEKAAEGTSAGGGGLESVTASLVTVETDRSKAL